MDLSSLPEEQRQQLQQLQQKFQEHQLQQQQQQQQQEQQQQQQIQDYASQAYDPNQAQAYYESYYAYYQYQGPQQSQQYSQQQEQQQQEHQHQHFAYYHPDYGNAYQQQAQQHEQQHSHPESAPVNQPGISGTGESQPQMRDSGGTMAPAADVSGQGQVQHQDNVYYPQQGGLGGDQQNPGYAVPPGLNPAAAAAVAALSQLTQFAGTMGAAEKAIAMVGLHARGGGYGPMTGPGPGMPPFMGPEPMHHVPGTFQMPVGKSLNRGGRRGGGPFRGNDQGNFGNHPPKSGGTGPPFRGRGRGRGRGGPRRFPPNDTSSSHPKPSANVGVGLNEENTESTVNNHEEAEATQISAQKQGNTAPNKRPPQAAWCELCRVDCTSLEILEQHKNGKRHKKNLQKLEESRSASKPVSEKQQKQSSVVEFNAEVTLCPEIVQEGEDKKEILPENLASTSVNENNAETEQQNDKAEQPENPVAEQSENPVAEQPNLQGKKPWVNHFDDQRRGMKRKMRGGRGGKRMKTFDAPRRPMEPPKPKVVIPLICDLCNVKCDTREVFERHLAGKKHISKLKRFEGHQAMYGPSGLQALYPPNPMSQTLFPPQGPQQVFYGPQGPYPPPGSYMPPQAHHLAPSAAGPASGFQQNPNHQVSGTSSNFYGQKAAPEAMQQSALVVTGTKQNDLAAQHML